MLTHSKLNIPLPIASTDNVVTPDEEAHNDDDVRVQGGAEHRHEHMVDGGRVPREGTVRDQKQVAAFKEDVLNHYLFWIPRECALPAAR